MQKLIARWRLAWKVISLYFLVKSSSGNILENAPLGINEYLTYHLDVTDGLVSPAS